MRPRRRGIRSWSDRMRVTLHGDPSCLSVLGRLMIICSVATGIPVAIIVSVSSASPTAKLIAVAIFIGMFIRRPPPRARIRGRQAGRDAHGLRKDPRPGINESSKLESYAIEDALAEARPAAVPRLLLGGVYVL